jgi:hypothetical protein
VVRVVESIDVNGEVELLDVDERHQCTVTVRGAVVTASQPWLSFA